MINKESPKKKYHSQMGAIRKSLREKGYSTAKEKSYFDYSTRERANIRENSKEKSNAHKWATDGNTKKENPFKKANPFSK